MDNHRTSKLNRDKEYEMDLSIESIRHDKVSYSEVLKLEEQIRFMQTTQYKRFKDILNLLVSEGKQSNPKDKRYIFSEETMWKILNECRSRYICDNCSRIGWHFEKAQEISIEYTKLEVTSQFIFDKETLVEYASFIADTSIIDGDYYEHKNIMESQDV